MRRNGWLLLRCLVKVRLWSHGACDCLMRFVPSRKGFACCTTRFLLPTTHSIGRLEIEEITAFSLNAETSV